MHASLWVCFYKIPIWQRNALTGARSWVCHGIWGLMCFFFELQSILQALLACACMHAFCVFKKNMDVSTTHNLGIGKGWSLIKLFPSAPLWSPVGIVGRNSSVITTSILVELVAKIFIRWNAMDVKVLHWSWRFPKHVVQVFQVKFENEGWCIKS